MNLAEKIITLRKQKGLSQEALAEKLNVSRQAVSRWESGTALPDATNILQLSKLFEVSTDYLLNDDYTSDQDIPAVKNQKEFILLIGMQVIAFVFHIISCFHLSTLIIFPILSLIINTLLVRKLLHDLEDYHYISLKTIKLYLTIYVCIIWLMALLPMLFVYRIIYMLFPSTTIYAGDASIVLSSGLLYIFCFLICSIPAALTIRYIHKK